MDPIEQGLRHKLAQASLSPQDVQEGMMACFTITNRRFLKRRLGDARPPDEIDNTTRELVNQVFAEVGVSAVDPALGSLQEAWRILDAQLGFEADDELLEHHRSIIQRLFDLSRDRSET